MSLRGRRGKILTDHTQLPPLCRRTSVLGEEPQPPPRQENLARAPLWRVPEEPSCLFLATAVVQTGNMVTSTGSKHQHKALRETDDQANNKPSLHQQQQQPRRPQNNPLVAEDDILRHLIPFVAENEGYLFVAGVASTWARGWMGDKKTKLSSAVESAARLESAGITADTPSAWESICSRAAAGGHLGALKYARRQQCPWDPPKRPGACAREAASGGHLSLLRWAHRNGLELTKETCSEAAKRGDLDLLRWARRRGCPWDKDTCSQAAGAGELEVLKWARQNGCEWDGPSVCKHAARAGELEVLKWARKNGCDWDQVSERGGERLWMAREITLGSCPCPCCPLCADVQTVPLMSARSQPSYVKQNVVFFFPGSIHFFSIRLESKKDESSTESISRKKCESQPLSLYFFLPSNVVASGAARGRPARESWRCWSGAWRTVASSTRLCARRRRAKATWRSSSGRDRRWERLPQLFFFFVFVPVVSESRCSKRKLHAPLLRPLVRVHLRP